MLEFLTNSPTVLALTVVGFIIAFVMSVGMGANDVANAFGTTYGAKLLNIYQIVFVASIFELVGALLIGTSVANTLRKGIINGAVLSDHYYKSKDCLSFATNITSTSYTFDATKKIIFCPEMISMIGSVSSLIGSSIWMIIANVFSLPVSTTHSIVGSYVGYGLVALHGKGINWKLLMSIVSSWFLSPFSAGLISISIWLFIYHFIIKRDNSFARGLKIMPFFYFITIFIIIFSVLYKGSKLLYFDRIPLWGVLFTCFSISFIVALVAHFVQVPMIRKKYSSLARASKEFTELEVRTDSQIESESSRHFVISEAVPDKNLDDRPTETEPKVFTESSFKEEDQRTSYIFRYMQILIACYGSFAHGGNDVSNSIAPLITIWLYFRYGGSVDHLSEKEIWLLVYGAGGIVLGLAVWGKRVLKTVGKDITTITPTMGYSIELGSVLTVVVLTRLGLPVSTTHCKIGSVILLGIVKFKLKSINKKLLISILLSWLVTVPVSGLISAASFATIQRMIFRPSP